MHPLKTFCKSSGFLSSLGGFLNSDQSRAKDFAEAAGKYLGADGLDSKVFMPGWSDHRRHSVAKVYMNLLDKLRGQDITGDVHMDRNLRDYVGDRLNGSFSMDNPGYTPLSYLTFPVADALRTDPNTVVGAGALGAGALGLGALGLGALGYHAMSDDEEEGMEKQSRALLRGLLKTKKGRGALLGGSALGLGGVAAGISSEGSASRLFGGVTDKLKGMFQTDLPEVPKGELDEFINYPEAGEKGSIPTDYFINKVYGDQAQSEVKKADDYNMDQGLPFEIADAYAPGRRVDVHRDRTEGASYVQTGLGRQYLNLPADTNNARRAEDTISRLGGTDKMLHNSLNDAGKFNGLTGKQLFNMALRSGNTEADLQGTGNHEMTHLATMHNLGRHETDWAFHGHGNKPHAEVYPMTHPAEMIPPLSALQQHNWKQQGSRLDSGGYNAWKNRIDALSPDAWRKEMESTPRELQRLYRYRDTLRKDNPRALQFYDDRNSLLIPGVVSNGVSGRPRV